MDYYINLPITVGQAVQTGLLLIYGEWFLDITEGTPYFQGVLGKHTQDDADATIRYQILQVQGIVDIVTFESVGSPVTRDYVVTNCVVNTVYGQTPVDLQNAVNF